MTTTISSPWQLAPMGLVAIGFAMAMVGMLRFMHRVGAGKNGLWSMSPVPRAEQDRVMRQLFDPEHPLEWRLISGGIAMFFLGMITTIIVVNI